MRMTAGLLVAIMLIATACGGSSDDSEPAASNAEPEGEVQAEPGIEVDAEDFIEDPEAAVEELADSLEEQQASQGGGGATLTVGDETWTFESVLCAIGEEQTGQEGAEFVLSSIQDGMQMYATIDSFGHSVSLNDIEDFENPAVALEAFGDGFVQLDGKNVSAEAEFQDGTSDDFTTIPGFFEGTCP